MLIGALTGATGAVSTAQNLIGGTTNAITNLFGSTKGTCGSLPSDAQLAHIIASADRNEPAMKRTRERFGRAKTEAPMYANGGPLDMAIYNAPISVVGAWVRYDCASAGPIRQSLAADLAALWQKHGGSFGTESFGSVAPGGIQPIAYDSGGLTGGVQYGDGGFSGWLGFGNQQQAGTPMWLKIVFGAVIAVAVLALITGRGGSTSGGIS